MMRGRILFLWIIAIAGCKKEPAQAPPTSTPAPATNYTPGAGAAQNVRAAVQRVVTLTELQNLGILIEAAYTESGRMPDLDPILADVKTQTPKLYDSIQDRTVILCWTTAHEGVWAYQAGAETHGGLALISGSARRVDADELNRLLQR